MSDLRPGRSGGGDSAETEFAVNAQPSAEQMTHSGSYGLSDIALVLAKAARPAVLAAVVLFGAAVLLQLTWLRVYTSQATLQLDPSSAAVLRSPLLLAKVADDPDALRLEIRRIPIVRDDEANVGWYDVRAVGASGVEARALLERVLTVLAEVTAPTPAEQARLEARRRAQLNLRDRVSDLMSALLADATQRWVLSAPETTETIIRLTELIEDMEATVSHLEESLAGFVIARDVIAPPSTPSEMPENIWRNATLAGLGGIFAVLMVALLADGLRRASRDPAEAARWNEVHRLLRMRIRR